MPPRICFVVLCSPHCVDGGLVLALGNVRSPYAIPQCTELTLDVDAHIPRPTVGLALVPVRDLALVLLRPALDLALARLPRTSFSPGWTWKMS